MDEKKRDRIILPNGLRLVCEAAGLDAAIALAVARGGTWYQIPIKFKKTELEAIVGTVAAADISKNLGGQRVYIPLGKPILAQAMRQEGRSLEKIAIALKCTVTSVRNWVKLAPPGKHVTKQKTGHAENSPKHISRSGA